MYNTGPKYARAGPRYFYPDSNINKNAHGQSLVHLINLLLGDDLVGVELGVWKAETYTLLLQNCPNIKTLYGVDSYTPFGMWMSTDVDDWVDKSKPVADVDYKEIQWCKSMANYNIKFLSGCPEKSILLEESATEAVNKFDDETFDFAFVDAYHSYEEACEHLKLWYPKIKPGGLWCCHDWDSPEIQQATKEFIRDYGISSRMSFFDNCAMWQK